MKQLGILIFLQGSRAGTAVNDLRRKYGPYVNDIFEAVTPPSLFLSLSLSVIVKMRG
jgi:hypothetical protein